MFSRFKMARTKGRINFVEKKHKSKSIKQRIRGIQRLLNKPDLPATVRVSKERILECLQSKLEEQQDAKKMQKMLKKYKMVKFFEKRKLWRQHRAVMKELNDMPAAERLDKLNQLQKKILQYMNYVEYFPSDKKYISLFPAQPYTNKNVIAEQEEVFKYINEKVDSGELPQAKFMQHGKETKRKISKERIHLDRRKPKKQNENIKVSTGTIEHDDFFIDTSGDQANIE